MKTITTLITLLLLTAGIKAQDTIRLAVKSKEDIKKLTVAEKQNGLYVFIKYKPIAPYTLLGEVVIAVMYFDYEAAKEQLISQAISEYNNADGIIITQLQGDFCKAEVIKFKPLAE